jgi:single-stranded DNA-specific DHH superfamily exonuclease
MPREIKIEIVDARSRLRLLLEVIERLLAEAGEQIAELKVDLDRETVTIDKRRLAEELSDEVVSALRRRGFGGEGMRCS